MHRTRLALAVMFILLNSCAAALSAQTLSQDRPKLFDPSRSVAEGEKQQRSALKTYALGKLQERQGNFVEALKLYEKSAKLDPKAVAVHKSLLSLYALFDRPQKALTACRKIIALDPADAVTWHRYARILKNLKDTRKAQAVLKEGLAAIDAKKHLAISPQMYADLGQLQLDAGDAPAAVRSFEQCAALIKLGLADLALEPFAKQRQAVKIAEFYERIGDIHAQAKDLGKARPAYESAMKIHPDGAKRLNMKLAQIASNQGNVVAALRYLDKYLTARPLAMDGYKLRIELLTKIGRRREISAWLEGALRQDHSNANLKLLLAMQYAKENQPHRAEKIFLSLVKDEPKSQTYQKLFDLYKTNPIFGQTRILTQLNETIKKSEDEDNTAAAKKANAQAQAMIAALRGDKALAADLLRTALPRLGPRNGLEYGTVRALAILSEEHRNAEQALRFYRDLARRPNPSMEALVYSGLLRSLWKLKRTQEVITVCRDGLRSAQATNRILFHSNLARALAHLNKIDEALKEANESVGLATDGSVLTMHDLRLRILTQAGRYGEAEKEFLGLLKTHKQPDEILRLRYSLSYLYSAMRNFPKAVEQLQLILKIDPENATACNDLGYMWADQGRNLAEAERLIRKAIALDRQQSRTFVGAADAGEDKAAYIDSLGWVLFRRGKWKEAKELLEKAAKLEDGNDPVIWDHLGDVYFRLEQPNDAQRCWRRALQLFEETNNRARDQRFRDLQQKIDQLKNATNR